MSSRKFTRDSRWRDASDANENQKSGALSRSRKKTNRINLHAKRCHLTTWDEKACSARAANEYEWCNHVCHPERSFAVRNAVEGPDYYSRGIQNQSAAKSFQSGLSRSTTAFFLVTPMYKVERVFCSLCAPNSRDLWTSCQVLRLRCASLT